jgi:hypothetical protein
MNKSNKLISLVLATGAAGVAFFSFANGPFSVALPGDVIIGLGASVAVIGLAVSDYSRRMRSLTPPARLLRPALPAVAVSRSNAGALKISRKDCLAA